MKKNLILLISCLFCFFSEAQSVNDSVKQVGTFLTESEFQKAINAYIKMTRSETYIANRQAVNLMLKKMNNIVTESIMDDVAWSKWISENLSKTKFKSIEEANNLRKLNLDLTKKQFEENVELYEMIRRGTPEQVYEIFRPERAGRPF